MSVAFTKMFAALLGAVLLASSGASVFDSQVRDLLDHGMVARAQKEYVPGSMELFAAADGLPGRLEFSLSDSKSCAYVALSHTLQTDSCFVHEDISYKIQLVTDSCAGASIQYFHDKDCTLFAGSKAVDASKLACRQVSTDGGLTHNYAAVACHTGAAKASTELNLLADPGTADPSAEPTAAPTLVPTGAPSAFPSSQNAILVIFTVKQTIKGISLTVYLSNPNNEAVLKKTVASVMVGVTVDDLKDWVVKAGTSSRRLSSQRLGRGFSTLADSIEISYTVQTMSQLTSQDLQQQLVTATEDGTFDTNLHTYAASDNAPDLLTAETDPATTAEPSASSSDGGSDGLSGGGIAGIVIGVVFGVILIALVAYYFIAAPKGNTAANEGHDYTVAL